MNNFKKKSQKILKILLKEFKRLMKKKDNLNKIYKVK